jgi:hypothetical protein
VQDLNLATLGVRLDSREVILTSALHCG